MLNSSFIVNDKRPVVKIKKMILSNNRFKVIHAQPSNFSDYHINETHVTFIESEEIELDSLEVDQPVQVCSMHQPKLIN